MEAVWSPTAGPCRLPESWEEAGPALSERAEAGQTLTRDLLLTAPTAAFLHVTSKLTTDKCYDFMSSPSTLRD